MKTYYINRMFASPIKINIEGVPPCLWCGEPVVSPSMDGPLVCALCDMGMNEDGTKWTPEQYQEKLKHFNDQILKYVGEQ